MGTIVCQVSEGTIGHFEDENTSVVYGNCGCECVCARQDHAKAL
ncbi:GapA-binding peptide SR1P [Bacillus cereus]|nr:GapA-binding peptide SR1P [Bacillus cereus]